MAKAQEWVEDSVGLNQKDRIIKQIVYNLILVIVCVAVLYPVIWVVKMALTPNEMAGIGGDTANISFTLDNFSHVRSGLCNLAIYKDGKSIYSQDVMIATTDRNRYIVSVTMPQGEITTKTRSAASVAPMDYWLFPEKK